MAPELRGAHYGPGTDLAVGLDVCVYTHNRSTRPWLGRVVGIFPETMEFDCHWYQVIIYNCVFKIFL